MPIRRIAKLIFLLPGLVACSGHHFKNYKGDYRAEPVDKTMRRLHTRVEHINPTPTLRIMEIDYQLKKRRGRAPASAKSFWSNSFDFSQKDLANSQKLSDRRLYFMALYDQFKKFKSVAQSDAPVLKSCPQFHSGLVKENLYQKSYSHRSLKPKSSRYLSKTGQFDQESWFRYPELSLPMTSNIDGPLLGDIVKADRKSFGQALDQAIRIHLNKTYRELVELCEFGQGQNMYIFVNLITHMKEHKDFKGTHRGMRSLLKTTIFSNLAILSSLGFDRSNSNRRAPASLNAKGPTLGVWEAEVFKRMDAYWSRPYYLKLSSPSH